jgi:hypothetical protein
MQAILKVLEAPARISAAHELGCTQSERQQA